MTDLTDITFYLAVNDIGEVGTSMDSAEDAILNLYWESGLTGAVNTFRIDTSVPLPKLGDIMTTDPPLISSMTVGAGVATSQSVGVSRSWSTSSASNVTGKRKTNAPRYNSEEYWLEQLQQALDKRKTGKAEKK